MNELRGFFPDVDTLLSISVQELAAKILYVLRIRQENGGSHQGAFHAATITGEFKQAQPDQAVYLKGKDQQVMLAISEAWAWLEGQALLVPQPGDLHGWRMLARRAKDFEDGQALKHLTGTSFLKKEALRHEIANVSWLPFVRGDYETAVFKAMRQVEIELRQATSLGGDIPAVKLARTAFDSQSGKLTDNDAEESERQAMAHLFAGALGVLKNPHSHRSVDVSDPAEAAALIMFASYLVSIIDKRFVAFILS